MNGLASRIRALSQGLPDALLAAAFGPAPRNDLGVVLDLRTHVFLQMMRVSGIGGLEELSVERARAEQSRYSPRVGLRPRPLARVEDVELSGPAGPIPARVYGPADACDLPLLVYFHGGGFVVGGSDTHDGVCRTLADDARCVVVSVDYRLAAEHPYPAAIDDALAAFRQLREHAREFGGRSDLLAVAGDSAGATLATLVCHRLREAQDPALANDPKVSPLLASQLDGLAPALMLTAGFDPLRDEGQAYAEALRRAGVSVEHRCHARLIHGFFNLGRFIPAAREAVSNFADRLRVELHRHAGEVE